MERIERTDGRVNVLDEIRYLDPDVERRRIALGEIEAELKIYEDNRVKRERHSRNVDLLCGAVLLIGLTLFWGGIIWLAER